MLDGCGQPVAFCQRGFCGAGLGGETAYGGDRLHLRRLLGEHGIVSGLDALGLDRDCGAEHEDHRAGGHGRVAGGPEREEPALLVHQSTMAASAHT